MHLYLIRHTQPNIAPGICYGRSDIDVADNFQEDVAQIMSRLKMLKVTFKHVYSSPLIRCAKLASALFPKREVHYMTSLQEMDFGDWEMRSWDNIGKSAIDAWNHDLLDYPIPNGETTRIFYRRCCAAWQQILLQPHHDADAILIIAHSGVIKLLIAHIMRYELKTALKLSIDFSSLHKLCLNSHRYQLNVA